VAVIPEEKYTSNPSEQQIASEAEKIKEIIQIVQKEKI
jgi:hypothetical protein